MEEIYRKPEFIDWDELSTPEDKCDLREYIKSEDTQYMYGGKDTGVMLYMRDGTFKHASYATIELFIDDAIAWSRCDIFKRAAPYLNEWRAKNDPLFKLTQAANIYSVNLEENATHVYDWYHEAHVYTDDVKEVHFNPVTPMRSLSIDPAEFTDETANALYSLWIDFEDGFVYFICAKNSCMDRMVNERIPTAKNLNLTKALTELYNNNEGFRSCCNQITKRLEEKE